MSASSLITVTNTNDSGEGSLRWAITQANACADGEIPTIVFDAALAGQTIALATNLELTHAARLINGEESPVEVTGGFLSTSADLHMENMVLPKLVVHERANLSGSGNRLTAQEGLLLENFEGSVPSDFIKTLSVEGAYAGISGDLKEASLGALTENMPYKILGTSGIPNGCSVILQEGTSLDLSRYDLNIGGEFVAECERGSTGIISNASGARFIVWNAASLKNVNIDFSHPGCSVHVTSGGHFSMDGGCVDIHKDSAWGSGSLGSSHLLRAGVIIEPGGSVAWENANIRCQVEGHGTLSAENCVFDSYISVTQDSLLQGSGNVSTGEELIRLVNYSGNTDELWGFFDKTGHSYVRIAGTLYDSTLSSCPHSEGKTIYKVDLENVSIAENACVNLEDGCRLYTYARTLSVEGTLSATFAEHENEANSVALEFGGGAYGGFHIERGGKVLLENSDISGDVFGVTIDGGGVLDIKKGNILLHREALLRIEEDGVLRLDSGTVGSSIAILCQGTIEADNAIFENQMDLASGGVLAANGCRFEAPITMCESSSLRASFSTFQSEEMIRLVRWSGRTSEIQLVDSSFDREASYITLSSLSGDAYLDSIPDGVECFRLQASIDEDQRVYVSEGIVLRGDGGVVHGVLEFEEGSVFRGSMTVASGGVLKLNGTLVDGTIILEEGARIEGHDNIFTSREVFRIRCDADIDLIEIDLNNSSFPNKESHIGLSGSEINGETHYRVLGGGLSVYRLNNGVTVKAGAELHLEEGTTLESLHQQHDLCVEGKLVGQKACISLQGHSKEEGGDLSGIEIRNGGVVELTDTRITAFGAMDNHSGGGYYHNNIEVQSGGSLTLTDCTLEDANYVAFNPGSVVKIKGTLLSNMWNGTELQLDDSVIGGRLVLWKEGVGLSGLGNVFTGEGEVIRLENASVDMSSFRAEATQEGAYIGVSGIEVNGEIHYTALGESLSVYRLNNSVMVKAGAELHLEEGTTWESLYHQHDLYVEGKLVGQKACISLQGHSSEEGGDLSGIEIKNGGVVELTDTRITAFGAMDNHSGGGYYHNNIEVQSGGSLTLAGCTLETVNYVKADTGSTVYIERTAGLTSLQLGAGANVDIHGSDLSQLRIAISGNQAGDNVIDLSGNYWGTSDYDEIMARISGDASRVVINDWLLVDPLSNFVYSGTSLRNSSVGKNVREFDLVFTHEIDAATVTPDSVRLLDAKGNDVAVRLLGTEGKKIRLDVGELVHGQDYRLVLGDEIADIAGTRLVHLTESSYDEILHVDYVAPRVSHVEPGGDFAGTLESLKIYMTDAVDVSSLRQGVSVTGPDGLSVAIRGVADLGGNVYRLDVEPQTAAGVYSLTVGADVMDRAGNRLNQNGNDLPGEAEDVFVSSFAIADVDLTITEVRVESQLVFGENVTVSWTGANATGYELRGSWTDGVYLSRDHRWDIDDILLGEYRHEGGLAAGGAYSGRVETTLSGLFPGDYYVLVRSDKYGQEQANKESADWAQNLMAVPVHVSVPGLKLGEAWQGSMSARDSFDCLVLHQEAGQSVLLSLLGSEALANMEIFVAYGKMPTRESYDMAWQMGKSSGDWLLPARQASGDVYILVNNKSSSLALDYSLTAQAVPMGVTSVTPTTQGRQSAATFDVYGVNFTPGTRVYFVDAAGNEYLPDDLNVISSERIRVRYEAKRLPAETLDLVVKSETEEVNLENVIQMTDSTGAHLKIARMMPKVLGYHIMSTLKIMYENTGTDPMHAPLLTLTGKQNGKTGAIMTMDPSIVNQGFWTDAMPEGFANSVSFLAYSPSTPGWLMPTGRDEAIQWALSHYLAGSLDDWYWYKKSARLVKQGDGYQVSILNSSEVLSKEPPRPNYVAVGSRSGASGSGRAALVPGSYFDYLDSESYYKQYLGNTANVYYCGWQQPWDYSYPPFHFELGYLGTDNTASLNWYDSFSYTDMPSELKSALANSLSHSAGSTWGDYVLMLNENLIYLDGLGCVTTSGNAVLNTDSLVEFELMKANGSLTPVNVLSSSIDMTVSTPGLSLGFSRAYANNISSRFNEGAFGYGWTHNWDMALSFREDGTVVYAAAGAKRVYQPDFRGGYVNTAGDRSELTKAKDGSYVLKEASGLVSRFSAEGRLLSETDANGNAIVCSYNEAGQLVRLTHSNGEFLALEWNDEGYVSRMENSLGDAVTYDYSSGHLVRVADRFGDAVRYGYSSEWAHALVSVVGADGIAAEFTYNRDGLLEDSFATSADGGASGWGKVTLSYGDDGEVTVTDVYGASSTYYYDNKGLVRRAIDVNGNAIRYGYDAKGNMVWCTDQSGNTSSYTYDAWGNMTSSTDALGHTTTFTYTEANRVDVLTDALGRSTDYDYDAHGNMTSITYEDGSSESWTYDAAGNADSWTNRRGRTIRSEYDAAGRVTARTYEDGTSESFVYDERGHLLSATDATGTTRYAYDARFNVTRIDMAGGRRLSYEYDAHDRRVAMEDELGNRTLYAYDGFGLLSRVTDGEGGLLAAYTYDLGGRLTVEEKGDGTQTLYRYTKAGQTEEIRTLNAAGETLSFCRYTYDATGMRTSMTTQEGVWTYEYDRVGQLTHAVFAPAAGGVLAAQDLRYEYDAAGNRVRSVVNGVEMVYKTNSLNQTMEAGEATYAYDEDGNMVSKTDASGTTLYTWDDDNRLVGVRTSTGDVYAYAYNAFGDRVSVTVNGKTTQYVYDPSGYGNLTGEYDAASGEQNRTYTHGNGLIGFDDAMSGRYWYQGDALGSVTGITDESGNLVATYAYDPFGAALSATGDVANAFRWVGLWGLSQEETGLAHMRARYYDAETGKFISADPIGVNGGLNLYAYCENNGVMGVDPSGWRRTLGGVSPQEQIDMITNPESYGFEDRDQAKRYIDYKRTQIGRYQAGLSNDIKKLQPLLAGMGGPEGVFNPYNFAPGFRDSLSENHNGDISWLYDDIEKWLKENEPSTTIDSGDSDNVNTHDPNDLLGPVGYGEENFIAPGQAMSFMLRFENEEKATAATHWMRVFTTFDEAYDLDSFTLDSFCLAGNLIELTEKSDSFNRKVMLTVDGREVLSDVKINLDRETRELKAEFMAVDPATGLMIQDPELGMLYPNDATGRGDGYIVYTISTGESLADGTTVDNAADIYFDFNEVIPTPELHYTIDATAPVSAMIAAVDTGENGEAILTWEGADNEGGSGVESWCVFVSKDGGAFELWKIFDAGTTSATFAGRENGTYGFMVLGADHVGNVEAEKTAAEATLTLTSSDVTAPEAVSGLCAVVAGDAAALAWQGSEDPSGVSYVLEYAADGDWERAVRVTTEAPYAVARDLAEGRWQWRVQAVDGAGNAAPWVEGEAFTVDVSAPEVPRESLAVWANETAAQLSWAAVEDPAGVAGYRVQYGTRGDFEGAQSLQVSGPGLTVFDLEANAMYYWRVAAVDGLGNVGDWQQGEAFGTQVAVADNAPGEATLWSLAGDGSGSVRQWVGFGDAADYFRLSPERSGSYTLQVSGADGGVPEAYLYVSFGQLDAQGRFSASEVLAAGPQGAVSAMDGLVMEAGREYYVRVEAFDRGAGAHNADYTLSMRGTFAPEAAADDAPEQAHLLTPMEEGAAAGVSDWVGYGDATDFYAFSLEEAGTLRVGLGGLGMPARVEVFRQNAAGGLSQVMSAAARVSGLDRELALSAGAYFVQVSAYDGGAGRYNTAYELALEWEREGERRSFGLAAR